MDYYITITSSNQNPCEFVSNFTDVINLSDGYEVAVVKLFHAPLYNITEDNNTFTMESVDGTHFVYSIPPGFYPSTCDILGAIYRVLAFVYLSDDVNPMTRMPLYRYKTTGEASSLQLQDGTNVLFVIDENNILLKYLGYCVGTKVSRLDINHIILGTTTEVGFLYSNIVTNSIIDQQQSRLLACLPIKSKQGYNCLEVVNRIYYPLSVHSFTDLAFTLTDVRGNLLKTAYLQDSANGPQVIFPTIIILHIRKIYK